MTACEMEAVESCRSLRFVPVSPTLYEPLKSRLPTLGRSLGPQAGSGCAFCVRLSAPRSWGCADGAKHGVESLVRQIGGDRPLERAAHDLKPDAHDNVGRKLDILQDQAPLSLR